MRCGAVPYKIEAIVNGVSVTPNLTHLENMLKKIGYTTKPHLKALQDGTTTYAEIIESKWKDASHIRKNQGFFELVVYYEDERLEKFAENYKPVPLNTNKAPAVA